MTLRNLIRGTDLATRRHFLSGMAGSLLGVSAAATFGPGEIVYHLDVSLMPNWIGKTERRFWSVTDDTLTITTPPLLVGGKMQISTLVYQRAEKH